MTLEYKVETNSLYRETEYGKEYDGSDYVDITFEPSRQELKDALKTIISKKFFNNDYKAVESFIDELDEINDLTETFKEDLQDFFRVDAREQFYD